MKPRLQVSRSAVELIKSFEGYRERAVRLEDGRWTIGYGHTLTAREGAKVSEAEAEALLLYDLIAVSHAINEWSFTPLDQHQFDALASFAFNIGLENFRHSSTLRRLNEGRQLEAALAMELWRKSDLEGSRIVVDALVRRRAAEKALFLTPMDGWVPAPSPMLPPRVDYDVAAALPLESPAVFRAEQAGDHAYARRDAEAEADVAPRDDGSASEAAAAAVIARLEAIMPHAEDHFVTKSDVTLSGAKTTETKSSGPKVETPELKLDPQISYMTPKPRGLHPLLFVAMAVIGVGLFALGLGWVLGPATRPVMGMSARDSGLLLGIVGVLVTAAAIYILLVRIGGGPKSRLS